jgi:hypothetical protein
MYIVDDAANSLDSYVDHFECSVSGEMKLANWPAAINKNLDPALKLCVVSSKVDGTLISGEEFTNLCCGLVVFACVCGVWGGGG